jgi:polysaccharide export outer membrane protein
MSPVEAGKAIEKALKSGGYFIDPHVSLNVLQSRSQRVSVLGKVHKPGRYTIDPKTTVFDLVARAGGAAEDGADYAYVLRPDGKGGVQRSTVSLAGFSGTTDSLATGGLQGGDTLYIPQAEQFYIYGEVGQPSMYRLEQGMTVLQAVARAGGITPRGSERRIDIKRTGPDGRYVIIHAKLAEQIRPGDVIHVKESIF